MQCRKFSKKKDFFGHGSIFRLSKTTFKVDGKRKKFKSFYPEADVNEIEYAVVCTQDCDIAQKNKVTHINIALLEPIHRPKKDNPIRFLDLNLMDLVDPFEDMSFYSLSKLNSLRGKIEEMVDNNSSHYMFLEIGGKYYFANLAKIFPIKFGHLEEIKKNAKHQLNGGFKHLLGWKLASLYGRVGVELYKTAEREETVKKVFSLVGSSLKWPNNSFELTDEQYQTIKSDLKNYNGEKKAGKTPSAKMMKKIFSRLEEFRIVAKSENG